MACCRTDWGMVSPRVWAVLRLMTKSNLLGCSTGRFDNDRLPLDVAEVPESLQECPLLDPGRRRAGRKEADPRHLSRRLRWRHLPAPGK